MQSTYFGARNFVCTFNFVCFSTELQGHAIKNQDLLIASGAVTLRGSDGMSSLEEDIETVCIVPRHPLGCLLQLISAPPQSRTQLSAQQQLRPDLETRNHELTEIAKSIASLAELFKDLSSLVIDQGTILDSIEYNVEQTATHVEEAAKELNVATQYAPLPLLVYHADVDAANRYQRNTGRRTCIFLLLLIIFGLVIILIFKPRRQGSPIESPS